MLRAVIERQRNQDKHKEAKADHQTERPEQGGDAGDGVVRGQRDLLFGRVTWIIDIAL